MQNSDIFLTKDDKVKVKYFPSEKNTSVIIHVASEKRNNKLILYKDDWGYGEKRWNLS